MIINIMFISYVAKMCTTYAILWDLYIAKQAVFRRSQLDPFLVIHVVIRIYN